MPTIKHTSWIVRKARHDTLLCKHSKHNKVPLLQTHCNTSIFKLCYQRHSEARCHTMLKGMCGVSNKSPCCNTKVRQKCGRNTRVATISLEHWHLDGGWKNWQVPSELKECDKKRKIWEFEWENIFVKDKEPKFELVILFDKGKVYLAFAKRERNKESILQ